MDQTCQACGKDLPADAPNGSCPNCLLGLAMNNPLGNSTAAHLSAEDFQAPRADQLVGVFPNLEIIQLLGHGGMGAVYEAKQTNLDRRVALKILSPKLNSDPTFAERFTREAKALAKLSHSNIVMIFDFGIAEEMHYLVMEFVDGVNLREAIGAGQISSQEALEVIPQICDALQFAHDQGVIHRDIKPENILINKSGQVKIADFGLAKLQTTNNLTLTGTRQVLGTASYMAPEQIEKPNFVDHRADIYSLGVVFYELLTGELPIGRFSLPSEKAAVSTNLDEVVMRTLEKEPEKRFQQASHVRTAVETADVELVREAPFHPDYSAAEIPESKFHGETYDTYEGRRRGATMGRSETVALPFKLQKVYGGLAEAAGIVRGHENGLKFEFEVKDNFNLTKSAPKFVVIPYDQIISVERKEGWFGLFADHITLQAESIEVLKKLPTSSQGKVTFTCLAKDRPLAERFMEQISYSVRNVADPSRPIKSETGITEVELVAVEEKLKVPKTGFLLAAIIHLVVAAAIATFFSPLFFEIKENLANEISTHGWGGERRVDAATYGLFHMWGFILGTVSIFLSFLCWKASRNYSRKSDYFPTLMYSLFALFPFGPAALVAVPSAIWGIVVLAQSNTRKVFQKNAIEDFRARNDWQVDNPNEKQMKSEALTSTIRAAGLFLFLFISVAIAGGIVVWGTAHKASKQRERQQDAVSIDFKSEVAR